MARRLLTKLEASVGEMFWTGHGHHRRVSLGFIQNWLREAADREDEHGFKRSPPLKGLQRCVGCRAPATWDRVWNYALGKDKAHRLHWRCPTSRHKKEKTFKHDDTSCDAFSNWYSNCNKVHARNFDGAQIRKPLFFDFLEKVHIDRMAEGDEGDHFRNEYLGKKYEGLTLRRSDGSQDPLPVYNVVGPGISWKHLPGKKELIKKFNLVSRCKRKRDGTAVYYLQTGRRTKKLTRNELKGEGFEQGSFYEINDDLHKTHILQQDNPAFRFVAAGDVEPELVDELVT